jgi:hypothetical protein
MANLTQIIEYVGNEIEVGRVFDRNNDINTDNAIAVGKKIYKNVVPGFFTPYQSRTDFGANLGLALASPIYIPLLLGTLGAICAIGAAVAAITFVGSLMFAAATCCFDSELAEAALVIAVLAGGITLGCLAATLIAAVGILVSVPQQIVQLTTRSLASIPSLLGDVPVNEEDAMVFAFS